MSLTWGSGGDTLVNKKLIFGVLALYVAAVGIATIASGSMANSPTLDTVAGLPSTGSLLGSTGTTAGVLDIGTAAAIYFFALR